MNRRTVLALLVLALAFTLPASMSSAKVEIKTSDTNHQVDVITKGKCRVSGKKGSRDFFLYAKSKAGKFLLSIFIDHPTFTGFKDTYSVYYGGTDPQIFLHRNSDDEVFSNFKLAGTPAGTVWAGAVAFRKNGRRVGVGLYGASNKAATEGYSFAGPINCKYRKR